jgi:hypothetical protein
MGTWVADRRLYVTRRSVLDEALEDSLVQEEIHGNRDGNALAHEWPRLRVL